MSLRLNNWSVVEASDPYMSPEQRVLTTTLMGNVSDHPRFPDGAMIRTSMLRGKRNNKIVTFSGSEYELEEVDPDYEKIFPNAKEKLFASLEEV